MGLMYLSGVISRTLLADPRPDVGIMLQPNMGNDPKAFGHWRRIGADNGCFADTWDARRWLAFLVGLIDYQPNVLFAVAPDVVGDAAATLERSRPYLPLIRTLGFPAAFVSQDGLTVDATPWGDFDVLFVGGTDLWKYSDGSRLVMEEARRRGIPIHVGRVNTERALRECIRLGVDTADGTYLKWFDTNWPTLCHYLDRVNGQPALEAA